MAKFKKIPQPPIDRHGRDHESRAGYFGILLLLLGVTAAGWSAVNQYQVINAQTPEEAFKAESLGEYELNKAFRTGVFWHHVPNDDYSKAKANAESYSKNVDDAKAKYESSVENYKELASKVGVEVKEQPKPIEKKAEKACPT